MKVKELRKLPFRTWNKETTYASIIVIPSGRKHDSGYALMYIIGVDENKNPIEISASCDDICWKIPNAIDYEFRNDMYWPSGIIHYWSNGYKFKVGVCTSSTDVTLISKK